MSSFQSLARICLCLKVRNVPGSCCMLYFLTAFFPVGRCFVLAAFIIPQIVTPFLLVLGAMPPRGHAFLFCFSFLFRSLSFLFFASCLHLDNPAFRFDSRHCRTFPLCVGSDAGGQRMVEYAILSVGYFCRSCSCSFGFVENSV